MLTHMSGDLIKAVSMVSVYVAVGYAVCLVTTWEEDAKRDQQLQDDLLTPLP